MGPNYYNLSINNRKQELKQEFDFKYEYKNRVKSLEKENNHLYKIIDKFYKTVEKFIDRVCHKFGIGESKELVKNFQEETNTYIYPIKQLNFEGKQKELEWDLER